MIMSEVKPRRSRHPEPRDFEMHSRYYGPDSPTLAQLGAEYGLTGNQVWWRVFKVGRYQYEQAESRTAAAPLRVVGNVVYLPGCAPD